MYRYSYRQGRYIFTYCIFRNPRNGTTGTTWHRPAPPASTNHRAAAPLPIPPPSKHQAIPSGANPPPPNQWGPPANLLPAARQQPPPAWGNVPSVSVPGCAERPLRNTPRRAVPRKPWGPGDGPSPCHPANAQCHHEPPTPQPEQERRGCRHGLQAQPRWNPVSGDARERARRKSPQPPPSDTTGPAAAATAASTAAAGGGTLQEPRHHARVSSRGATNTHRTDSG